MKPVKVTPKKMFLNLETLRSLNAAQLVEVGGGMMPRTDLCTAGNCGTSRAGCF